MDPWSARLANRLVGNIDWAPVLEVTLLGPELRAGRDAWIAVTGACFDVDIANRPWRSPLVARIARNTVVRFRARQHGTRAYIAINGGLRVQPTLGSSATTVRARLGGIEGRALRSGDEVPLGPSLDATALTERHVDVEPAGIPKPGSAGVATLDVLPGAADEWTTEAVTALCTTTFTIASDSDRMGYRLVNGEAAWPAGRSALLSQPTTLGAVQLPAGGDPILLMADRQTTGGYAQIAVLSRSARSVAGQLGPGDRVAFRAVSLTEAREIYHRREAALDALVREVKK
jgi:biotin-dependent carboxylase-like uncharacterized protein